MKTIKEVYINEIIIKNSRFIAIFKPLNSENEVSNILSSVKNEYKNANHYCYAYITGNIKRCSDDGEPSGTAGVPILNILEKNDLSNVICVIVRYFGGIKLGAGGLIRSYGKATRETLKISHLVSIIECYKVTLSFTYENLKNIDFIINKAPIINKTFNEDITYVILLKNDELDIVEKLKIAGSNILNIKKDYFFNLDE